jgi:hypothetical protein
MQVATRVLFGFAMIVGLGGILGGALSIDLSQWGLEANWRHVPLLIGLLVLFLGNFAYYTGPIERAGEETPAQTLLSLVGMLVMAALPVVVLSAGLAPWRYLAIAVYGVLVVLKNRDLSHRLDAPDARRLSRIWTRRAMLQTALCFGAGLLYFILIHPAARSSLFQRVIEAPVLTFRPAFANLVNLSFNTAFLVIVAAMFVVNHKDLQELKSTGASGLGTLKPIPKNAIPPTGRDGRADDHA